MTTINKKIVWPQWLAGFTVSLGVLTASLANGWTSPFLAKLTSPDVQMSFKLNYTEASWVASLLSLGRVGGAIAGAISQGVIGRKRTILVGGLPLTFGWISMILASSVEWLYIARICNGLGSGMMWTAISLYIGEIADPSIRGSLIFLNLNAASVGTLLGNSIGPYIGINQYGYVAVSLAGVFIILFSLIPESPYHYVQRGDIKSAEKSLLWYKRNAEVTKEIQELKEFLGSTSVGLNRRWEEFRKPTNCKHLMIIFFLNIFLYCAGHNTIASYAEIIIIKTKVSSSPSLVVIALGVCTVIAGATATIFVDRCGRKSLLILSSLGVSLSMIMLGLHFHLLSWNIDPIKITWLPIFALFLNNFTVSYGMLPVPTTLLSELFSPILKTVTSMFFTFSSAFISFMTIGGFQPVLNIVGEKYIFFIFALSALCVAPFTYFLIPETRGKSLIEIQENIKVKKNIEAS